MNHVLVDEYQDTNPLQSAILLKLKPDGRGLMVVGDDAQAIYSFRAATVRNILRFPKQFRTKARIIKLEQNYRSTQPILAACNGVIGLAKAGFSKTLWSKRRSTVKPAIISVADERAQASWVAEQILKAREEGVPLKSQAVLFRVSYHSAQLEIELARRKIPFKKFGGLKFLEAAHVKDVISILRWRENPRYRLAGFRVLQLLPGIGPRHATSILDELKGVHDQKAMRRVSLPNGAAEAWVTFIRMVRETTDSGARWPGSMRPVLDWYAPYFQNKYDDHSTRQGDLDQLEQIASGFKTCERFLTDISLDPPDTTESGIRAAQEEDYTVLSTIHSAKGREWKMVRILSVVDGCIPLSRSEDIEEERRLLYVAMSRAVDQLDLIVPQQLFHQYQPNGPGQHHVALKLTRFIPSSIINLFERKRASSQRSWISVGSIVSLVSASGQIDPLRSEHGHRDHLVHAFRRPRSAVGDASLFELDAFLNDLVRMQKRIVLSECLSVQKRSVVSRDASRERMAITLHSRPLIASLALKSIL